jgi:hypothetical protein
MNSVVLFAQNLLLTILAKTGLMPSSLTLPRATTRTRSASAVSCVKPMTTENYMSLLMPTDPYLNMKKNYTLFLLELTACTWGIEHFSFYLRGRKFTLYTDHKPLKKLSTVHTKTLNRLQQAMSEHDFVICHKPRHEMAAKFLSQNIALISSILDHDLQLLQSQDEFISELIQLVRDPQIHYPLTRPTQDLHHVFRAGPHIRVPPLLPASPLPWAHRLTNTGSETCRSGLLCLLALNNPPPPPPLGSPPGGATSPAVPAEPSTKPEKLWKKCWDHQTSLACPLDVVRADLAAANGLLLISGDQNPICLLPYT